jgi:hypothetical protein
MYDGAPSIHRNRSGEVETEGVLVAVEHAMGRRPIRMEPRETLAPRFVWRAEFDDAIAVYVKAESETAGADVLVLKAWAMARARERFFPGPVDRFTPGVLAKPASIWRETPFRLYRHHL